MADRGGNRSVLTSSGSSGGGGALAVVSWNPADTSKTSSSATFADIDANLAITFTAPASGKVLVRLSGNARGTSGVAAHLWSVREGGTDLAKGSVGANSDETFLTRDFLITGLTPSSSHTYTWGFASSAGGSNVVFRVGGAEIGPAVMSVWAAP